MDRNPPEISAALVGDIVAPFTGAWIETRNQCNLMDQPNTVAPFTGAWIETRDLATSGR